MRHFLLICLSRERDLSSMALEVLPWFYLLTGFFGGVIHPRGCEGLCWLKDFFFLQKRGRIRQKKINRKLWEPKCHNHLWRKLCSTPWFKMQTGSVTADTFQLPRWVSSIARPWSPTWWLVVSGFVASFEIVYEKMFFNVVTLFWGVKLQNTELCRINSAALKLSHNIKCEATWEKKYNT